MGLFSKTTNGFVSSLMSVIFILKVILALFRWPFAEMSLIFGFSFSTYTGNGWMAIPPLVPTALIISFYYWVTVYAPLGRLDKFGRFFLLFLISILLSLMAFDCINSLSAVFRVSVLLSIYIALNSLSILPDPFTESTIPLVFKLLVLLFLRDWRCSSIVACWWSCLAIP